MLRIRKKRTRVELLTFVDDLEALFTNQSPEEFSDEEEPSDEMDF